MRFNERTPFNFSYVIEGRLAGSATPFGCGDAAIALEALKEQGVGAVLSLDSSGVDDALLRRLGLDHHLCDIADFTAPNLQQIDECVAFIDHEGSHGRAVVVHCHAGIGRTGTILACYLAKERSLSGDEAIHTLRRLRPGSIETRDQEAIVKRYAERLRTAE